MQTLKKICRNFKKRAKFPKFHKKGIRDSFRESDPKGIRLDQVNSRIQLPKIGWVRDRNSREVLWGNAQCHGQLIGGQVVRQH